MYLVRVSFTNRFGSAFSWDFEIPTNDYSEAISEAVHIFFSGLTAEERQDAANDLHVLAHPDCLPAVYKDDELSRTYLEVSIDLFG